MFQKGTQLLSGSPRRPPFPFPRPGLRPRRRREKGLSAPGWGWTRRRRTRPCLRVQGAEAGWGHPQQFDLPSPFLFQRGWRGSLPPALVSKPSPCLRTAPPRSPGAAAACPGRAACRGSGPPAPRTGPSQPGLCALVDRRLFPLDLTLGVTKAPFYFQCHFGVCLLFPATSRFQGYGRLPAGSGKG